jgi:hypothetical protein
MRECIRDHEVSHSAEMLDRSKIDAKSGMRCGLFASKPPAECSPSEQRRCLQKASMLADGPAPKKRVRDPGDGVGPDLGFPKNRTLFACLPFLLMQADSICPGGPIGTAHRVEERFEFRRGIGTDDPHPALHSFIPYETILPSRSIRSSPLLRSQPSTEIVSKIAATFDVPVGVLLGERPPRRRAKPRPPSALEERIEKIRQLPRKEQEFVIRMLDTVLEGARR